VAALAARWLLWLLESSQGIYTEGEGVDMSVQRLETGGQRSQLFLEGVWLLVAARWLLWLLRGCSWLLWLPCEIVGEGVADDGC